MKIKYRKNRGKFIRPCPCSVNTVSCGYLNLDLMSGCPFDCSYCILQIYLDDKSPLFYNNFKDLLNELHSFSSNSNYIRLGNGELCDSLAFDEYSNYSQKLLEIFKTFPEIIFEFKTKASSIKKILKKRKKSDNILFSWSLNPQEIIDTEEAKSASLADRLSSMRALAEKGYKVGIHLDPLILYPDWKEHYLELINEIKKNIPAGKIGWWSLGALRFNPELKAKIFQHQQSRLFCEELVPGYDRKYRYYLPIRVEAFKYLKKIIQNHISCEIPLYLCMESETVWKEVFPEISPVKETINIYLYQGFFRNK